MRRRGAMKCSAVQYACLYRFLLVARSPTRRGGRARQSSAEQRSAVQRSCLYRFLAARRRRAERCNVKRRDVAGTASFESRVCSLLSLVCSLSSLVSLPLLFYSPFLVLFQVLFGKRGPGLLEKQWEYPYFVADTLLAAEGGGAEKTFGGKLSEDECRSGLDAVLSKILSNPPPRTSRTVANPSSPLVHIFTHVRHFMTIEVCTVAAESSSKLLAVREKGGGGGHTEYRWMSEEELKEVGATSAIAKIAAVAAGGGGSGKKAKVEGGGGGGGGGGKKQRQLTLDGGGGKKMKVDEDKVK